MKNSPVIAFIGLTHLGLNSLVASAEKGFKVIGYDSNLKRVENINNSEFEISEPNFKELYKKNIHNITATNDISLIRSADLIYISTDVPTDDTGKSDLSIINDSIKACIPHLSSSANLIILCQVSPGFTRNISFPKDRLFYQVETLIFGKAVDRALNPERFIVGSYDPASKLPLPYDTYLSSFNCPILNMGYESAELTKIAINMFLISSVSTTNMLAEICERIGANWREIAPALKLDKRIGEYAYLSPGLGIAGGNLERDINSILEIGLRNGTHIEVAQSWVSNSKYRKKWATDKLKDILEKETIKKIALLGLTYKEDTHSLKNSASIELIKEMKHVTFYAYDPEISNLDNKITNVKICRDANEAYKEADLLIIMTPWMEFRSIRIEELVDKMSKPIIIDPYKVLNPNNTYKQRIIYQTLGE